MQRRLLIAGSILAGTAAAPALARKTTKPPSIIEQFATTLSAHDITAFGALFADDYVNHQMSAAAPPPPQGKSAKQATLDFFTARLAGIPDLRVIVETAMVTTGKAAASFIYAGTHGGTYFGIAPTGRTLRFTSCDIFLIRNGLIAEHWGMGDAAGILAQLKA
jgi:predicted ester cyclase